MKNWANSSISSRLQLFDNKPGTMLYSHECPLLLLLPIINVTITAWWHTSSRSLWLRMTYSSRYILWTTYTFVDILCSCSIFHACCLVSLTLHCELGRGSWRSTQAVAGCTGIFPGILRLDLGDDKGTINENTDSAFQVTVQKGKQ